jgi:hypothetical protein
MAHAGREWLLSAPRSGKTDMKFLQSQFAATMQESWSGERIGTYHLSVRNLATCDACKNPTHCTADQAPPRGALIPSSLSPLAICCGLVRPALRMSAMTGTRSSLRLASTARRTVVLAAFPFCAMRLMRSRLPRCRPSSGPRALASP